MATKHSSRNKKGATIEIRHRTTSPTLALLLPPPSLTQDDVIYGRFIKQLLEPFMGRVRGVEVPPSGIISGNIVLGSQRSENRAGPLDYVKRMFRSLTRRCWFSVMKVMDVLLRKDYLKDPAESVLNTRIETEWSDDEESM